MKEEMKEEMKVNFVNEHFKQKYSPSMKDDLTVLFQLNGISITTNVMSRLANNYRLDNDSVNACIQLIIDSNRKQGNDKVFEDYIILPSDIFHFISLQKYNFIDAKNIKSQKVFLFPKFFHFDPLNHWYLYCVFVDRFNLLQDNDSEENDNLMNTNTILILNSHYKCHDNISFDIRNITKFFNDVVFLDDDDKISSAVWNTFQISVPQQTNSTDCGVYMIYFIEKILQRNLSTKQQFKNEKTFVESELHIYRNVLLNRLESLHLNFVKESNISISFL